MKKNRTIVVIVTFNGMTWIEKCLKSCDGYEIIVVDNASTDDTVKFITQNFSQVKVLAQAENLGFGKANNLGISYALNQGADAVLLLNQDAYILHDTVEKLYFISQKYPEYGLLSPVHFNWEGDNLEFYFNKFLTKNETVLYDGFTKGIFEEVYTVHFVNAAAWYIPKSTLMTIGGFDPIFHHYGEDNNYCQRLSYHNIPVGVVTDSRIFHDGKKRQRPRNYRFGDKYYLNEMKIFLVEYADINKNYSMKDLKRFITGNYFQCILHLPRFNLNMFSAQLKKTRLFKAKLGSIIKSRSQNKTKGSHYLTINM